MGNKHQQLKLHQSFIFNPKWHRSFALGLFSFLMAYLVASILTPVKQSDATQLVDITNEKTGYYVRISGSSSIDISVDSTPQGQLVGAKDTITTVTNSPRGYQLYISASPNYLYLNGDSSTAAQGKFSPIGGDLVSPIILGRNTWGFAFNKSNVGVPSSNFADAADYATAGNYKYPTASATYTSIPTTELMVQSIDSDNLATDGTDLDVYYGIDASTDLPTGSYQGVVTWTAISEGVNVNADTMQDFTTAECQAMNMADASNYDSVKKELIDIRDGKWYTIARMKDGNCWMTSNLALDGGITLTPDDSNVSQNRELPASANITDGTTSAYDSPQIYTAVQNTTDSYGSKYGNLYNWNAATATTGKQATTGTAYESVCPKGWRLPDTDTSDSSKSIVKLLISYNLPTTGVDGITSESAIQTIQQAPLLYPQTGEYAKDQYSSGYTGSGQKGYLWARGVYGNATYAYGINYISATNNFANPSVYIKYRAFSVRCVFEGSTIENNMYMQDINLTMCNNLAESTTTSDNRRTVIDGRDGKSYKVSHLADGNCWMVSNLALDGNRTIQPTDSNVTQNRTLPANISNGTTPTYDTAQIYAGVTNSTTSSCDSSYPNCIISDIKYGNFYNWNAATATVGKQATTGTVTESICPVGWQLPNGTGIKSYTSLLSAYNITSGTGNANIKTIQQAPLYFALTGHFYSLTAHQGGYGPYWSNTTSTANSNAAFGLEINTSNTANINSIFEHAKLYSIPIRCLLSY